MFQDNPGHWGRGQLPKAHQTLSFLGHNDGHLPVGGELDLGPAHRVHLHHLVGQGVEVEEGADLAAERTRFVLVQRQLQAAGQGELDKEQRRNF